VDVFLFHKESKNSTSRSYRCAENVGGYQLVPKEFLLGQEVAVNQGI
jgi:hypothetical protein